MLIKLLFVYYYIIFFKSQNHQAYKIVLLVSYIFHLFYILRICFSVVIHRPMGTPTIGAYVSFPLVFLRSLLRL